MTVALWPGAALALSGYELLSHCEASIDTGPMYRGYCYGFIDGVAALLRREPIHTVCAPSGVTSGQLTDIIVKYLRDHPAKRHYEASSLVGLALMEAFPCKDKPQPNLE